MRGLKYGCKKTRPDRFVASLADAWIKIERMITSCALHTVASLADAWIEAWGAKNYIIHTKKKERKKKNGWNYYQKGNITYIRQWK